MAPADLDATVCPGSMSTPGGTRDVTEGRMAGPAGGIVKLMNRDFLIGNWALVVAAALLLAVAAVVVTALYRRSRSGRLRARVRALAAARRESTSAERRLQSLERQLDGLKARADKVRPSRITDIEGRHGDAQSLLKIAGDRQMIAENRLRQLILEEFPPARHEALRRRYLPDAEEVGRPFTF